MALFRTVDPALPLVTVAEARAQLRIDHEADDALLESLVRAATIEVEAQTGLALVEQDWRLTRDDWPRSGVQVLNRHPVRQILSVTVYGAEGEASILDPATYLLDAGSRPARLSFASMPMPERCMNGVEIDFRCGFGESGADVPDLLRRAVLLLVGHWYEFRGRYGPDDQPVSIPPAFDRLIAQYRMRRL